jgi:hypothetical protein
MHSSISNSDIQRESRTNVIGNVCLGEKATPRREDLEQAAGNQRSASFKFDVRSPRHCAVLLLVLCALFCLAAELSARFAFPRISRVEKRIESEKKAALLLSRNTGEPAVLLVGNSLFEKGINVPVLQQNLTGYRVRRFAVSNTSFLDWYYGLRRLFSEGSRPQVVVLGLTPRNMTLERRFEGDVSARELLRTEDVRDLGRELQKDNTSLSNLYFSNLSSFYGGRTQFRKWFLMKIMPDVETLASALRPPAAPDPPYSAMLAIGEERLNMLNTLCAEHGAKFIYVAPPVIASGRDGLSALQEAGRRSEVPVLAPILPGELGRQYFADGVHLTDEGALRFTTALSFKLKPALVSSSTAMLATNLNTSTPYRDANRSLKK